MKTPLSIDGKINFLLLAGVVALVLMSGLWKPGIEFDVFGTHVALQNLVRDVLLIVVTLLSLMLTPKSARAGNAFNWAPIEEVAKLFAGIFITIAPVIMILRAGAGGAFAGIVHLVTDASGKPIDIAYFWATGLLSSFLDNAPTYLVFFNLAGGDAQTLMTTGATTLAAISAGAVFMGANSYIGNAPNFMVKAIAESRGVAHAGILRVSGLVDGHPAALVPAHRMAVLLRRMTMKKVLVARPIFPDVIERLQAVFRSRCQSGRRRSPPTNSRAAWPIKDGALLAGDPVAAKVLEGAPNLKVVSNMAVGYNNFDMEALNAHGVLGTNTPDVLNETTADFGWALMMAAARRIAESEHFLRAGKWQQWSYDAFLGADVYGSTLGVIGMGRIGQALARRARGFNMRVIYHNRSRVAPAIEAELNAEYVVEGRPAEAGRSRRAGAAVHRGKPSHHRRGRTRAA